MKLSFDKRYMNIYLVGGIITACFAFMFFSTIAVLDNIGGGKTSGDLAREKARKQCEKEDGRYVRASKDNPLKMACIVNVPQSGENR